MAIGAMVVLETWYLGYLSAPLRVTSGSMFPVLMGSRQVAVCQDCGCRFAIGVEKHPLGPRAVCPNCGYADNDLSGRDDLPGDRVLLSRPIFQLRQPRRWEVVAFRNPEHPSQIAVKRVVGLPGESVQIVDGEIYINGEIQRKSLSQLRAMALPVFDANFSPKREPSLPPRWQRKQADSQWRETQGRWTRPATPQRRSIDWLTYRHWCRLPGQPGKIQACPITNVCAYNQARPQRSETVFPVPDLLLSFRLLSASGEGRLIARMLDGQEEFQVAFDPSRECYEVVRRGRPSSPLAQGRFLHRPEGERVEVALVDRQFVVAVDGHVLGTWPYERSGETHATSRPVAIGAQGLGVEVCDLRIHRDVYYHRPVGIDARWGLDCPYQLRHDEYFVLGDNSAISLDSRSWPGGPGVSAKSLVGKPFLVHFPARQVAWGSRVFLIPEVTEIRYIR